MLPSCPASAFSAFCTFAFSAFSAFAFSAFAFSGSLVLAQNEALVLGAEDSGTSAAARVTWSAYANETAVVSGGVDLGGLSWNPSATVSGAMEAVSAWY